jgi:hypothetical protein
VRAPRRGRRRAVQVIALVLGVFWGFVFFGFIDLISFAFGPEFHQTLILGTGWGLLFLFLVGLPLLCLGIRPELATPAAIGQVGCAAVAVALATMISTYPVSLLVAGALASSVVLLAAVGGGRRRAIPAGWRIAVAPGLLVVVAAGPAIGYACASARTTGSNQITDITWGVDHWPIQAAFPLTVLLAAALAAGHPGGWAVTAWSVGAATIWFAVVCWLEPDLPGSMGRVWSVITLAWAIAFVSVMHISARKGHRQFGAA